jgi:hypothetical protein
MAPINHLSARSFVMPHSKKSGNWAQQETGVMAVLIIVFIITAGATTFYATRFILGHLAKGREARTAAANKEALRLAEIAAAGNTASAAASADDKGAAGFEEGAVKEEKESGGTAASCTV